MLKREVGRVFLPYSLFEFIGEATLGNSWYMKQGPGVVLMVIFSFMTFIGIRKASISSAILFSEMLISEYLRIIQKLNRPLDKNSDMFFGLNFSILRTLKNHLLAMNKKVVIAILVVLSVFLGHVSVYVTLMGRTIVALLAVVHLRDNNWFVRLGTAIGTHNFWVEVAAHVAAFAIVFFVLGYFFRVFWAITFSLVGSLSILLVLEKFFNLPVGLEALFDESVPLFLLDPERPGILIAMSLFGLGLIFQLLILK